ncbi:hypothetical protein FTX61_20165 [Nitriliruptoraceae bacterium ZYF776]|nr:hypothetical protein [Profundirhabdus halotolerans]
MRPTESANVKIKNVRRAAAGCSATPTTRDGIDNLDGHILADSVLPPPVVVRRHVPVLCLAHDQVLAANGDSAASLSSSRQRQSRSTHHRLPPPLGVAHDSTQRGDVGRETSELANLLVGSSAALRDGFDQGEQRNRPPSCP